MLPPQWELKSAKWVVRVPEDEAGRKVALALVRKRGGWGGYHLLLPVSVTSAADAAGDTRDDDSGLGLAQADRDMNAPLWPGEPTDGGATTACIVGVGPWPAAEGMVPINMRSLRVARVRHGKGFERRSDGSGWYNGSWHLDVPHGPGVAIDGSGRLQATFREGSPHGLAVWVHSDGTMFRGYTAPLALKASHGVSLLNGGEYACGAPWGEGSTAFVDGSVHTGAYTAGGPLGRGTYTSVSGEVMEGAFDEWGQLTGDGSWTHGSSSAVGRWRRGWLYGRSMEMVAGAGYYEGDFRCGVRHGYGRWRRDGPTLAGMHVGTWVYGRPHGRGVLDCRPLGSVADAGAGAGSGVDVSSGARKAVLTPAEVDKHIPSDGTVRVEARWAGGILRAGGMLTQRHAPGRTTLKDRLLATVDGANAHLPLLAAAATAVAQAEERTAEERHLVEVARRKQQAAAEAANSAMFSQWSKAAHERMAAVVERNRTERAFLFTGATAAAPASATTAAR